MLSTSKTVERVHPVYNDTVTRWQMIHDLCDAIGIQAYIQTQVDPLLSGKKRGRKGSDTNYGSDGYRIGQGAIKRINSRFRERAVYTNVVGQTSRTMVGIAFGAPPDIELSAELEVLLENADGDGTTLIQFAQDTLREVIRVGRAGILVDYPKTDGQQSVAQERDNFPSLVLFGALSICDWETMRIGSTTVTSRLLLRQQERYTTEEQDEMRDIYIELWLGIAEEDSATGKFTSHHREWRQDEEGEWLEGQTSVILDYTGKPLERLPWSWLGSEANTHRVDFSPLRDLAELNAAHYNASAIYEDSVFWCGQVQPWISGIQPAQMEDFRQSGFQWGAGVTIPLPQGGQLGIVQAAPNQPAKESLDSKMQQMGLQGATLLQPTHQATKTATEVDADQTKQHSVLSWVSHNVSAGITTALEIAAMFTGGNGGTFDIETSFMLRAADPVLLGVLWQGIIQGKIADEDLHNYLSRVGLADPDFETWKNNLPEPEPVPVMGDFGEEDDEDDDPEPEPDDDDDDDDAEDET